MPFGGNRIGVLRGSQRDVRVCVFDSRKLSTLINNQSGEIVAVDKNYDITVHRKSEKSMCSRPNNNCTKITLQSLVTGQLRFAKRNTSQQLVCVQIPFIS